MRLAKTVILETKMGNYYFARKMLAYLMCINIQWWAQEIQNLALQ